MKTNKSFHKCIKCCIVLSLLVLVSVNGYCQETVSADSSVSAFVFKDFKEPQFKGKDFSVAIYNYFYSGDAFYFGSKPKSKEPEITYYEMSIKFEFDSDGSLKKASVVKSSGYKSLDKKVLSLSKNYARKKYMTPAYSDEVPVPCVITVPLLCKYYVLTTYNSNAPRNYGKYVSPRYNPDSRDY